ncbi:MAG: ABC transporter permease [Bacteroidetes bacterium]|nr:ABC transporter permease [Bacteroidota bacterium]
MRNILLVIQREYLSRVRNKFFILTTLLMPLLLGLLIMVPFLLMRFDNSIQRIVVVDESQLFKNHIPDSKSLYFFSTEDPIDSVKEQYRELNFTGVLYIPENIDIWNPKGFEYISDSQLGLETDIYIRSKLTKEIRRLRMIELDINPAIDKQLTVNLSLLTKVKDESGEKTVNSMVSTAIGYITGFMIYIVLLIYGTMVMRGVIEEKTSRIVEVMLSSLKPFQLMVGKIVGIAAVGLTQFTIWGISLIFINILIAIFFSQSLGDLQNMGSSGRFGDSEDIEMIASVLAGIKSINMPLVIFSFLFYFIGGYLLYATLFAAAGSAANDETDVQTLTFPVTIPVIISFFIMMAAIRNPDGQLAFWSSIIPFSSPLVMPARIPFGVPPWQIALSMVLLVLGFLGSAWIAAKIYRTGILLYGKKVTLREIGRWMFR